MLAMFGSALALFLAASLIGFALGWGVRARAHAILVRGIERDCEDLRVRLGEAHVRRAGRL